MKTIQEFADRIITGDCIEVMKEMPATSIDFIATDPPYLVNYQSHDGRSIANDDTNEWLAPAFAEMYRVLRYDRFLLSFYGWNKVDHFFAAWKAAGFRPVGHLVWTKNIILTNVLYDTPMSQHTCWLRVIRRRHRLYCAMCWTGNILAMNSIPHKSRSRHFCPPLWPFRA